MTFQLKRKEFLISVSFVMTINKSQGQTLGKVGLYLERPVFSQGQLYVAVSRVKSKKGLKVLCCDKDGNYTNTTTNVMYQEVLHRLSILFTCMVSIFSIISFISRLDVTIIIYKSFVLCYLYRYSKKPTTNIFLEDI